MQDNDFFSATASWCELDTLYQKHLRIANLVDRLSTVFARTRELPGLFPYAVRKTFIEAVIKERKSPALDLGKIIYTSTLEHVQDLVSKHFKDSARCRYHAEDKISWLLEGDPFSLNTHYLTDYKEKFLAYKGERQHYNDSGIMASLNEGNNPHITEALSAPVATGLSRINPIDLQKLLPSDEIGPALNIMADVRAYLQDLFSFCPCKLPIAFKRFADNVPLAIDRELVRGLTRDLLKKIFDELGTNTADTLHKRAHKSPIDEQTLERSSRGSRTHKDSFLGLVLNNT
ncbi:hypothetical protein CVT25_006378 [Psilocybe cyanescens]|uniref:Uncharacterized protein n=1 Tax=Psilocybe cyanescens TaxID=93625 RepID=A0A409XKK9_PSICY|nr:hypothetical protein CVT25_006378 [Psilocybe cyanescens]